MSHMQNAFSRGDRLSNFIGCSECRRDIYGETCFDTHRLGNPSNCKQYFMCADCDWYVTVGNRKNNQPQK